MIDGGQIGVTDPILPESISVRSTPVARASSLRGTLADYLSLTKPGVMSLLLVTEFLAMVVAARGWPGWEVSLAALGGGVLASGGASAINCWFDRDIDAVMGRTRNRPVPAGRIAPGRAIGFGLILSAAGFAVFIWYVNPLAAGLSLAGGAFYVFVYTFWLKRATKENIVIGGAAGAVPPLVGWAAVTHGIGPVGLALFAVIFLWTPPHFWALSLIIRRDYQAVAVPMRPVVVGLRRTKTGILGYGVLMLAATCGLGLWLGWAELGVALGLGIPFLWLSLLVLRETEGMRWARRLFQFSIVYLFAFFLGTALVAALAH
ncbi:MAG: protoheme IX farnesyltransferase [Candidatus Dormibacteraeota bacterium]|nr:protoheme IX farnesyltransferase [Candidatus Dormibacteraeota bacterium]